jgi:hypothetical protein
MGFLEFQFIALSLYPPEHWLTEQGCPAIFSSDLSVACKGLITGFVFREDIIPRLSIGLVRDFRSITINLAAERGIAESVISKVFGVFQESVQSGGSLPRDDLWYWSILKTLRADMTSEKLYPPGRK